MLRVTLDFNCCQEERCSDMTVIFCNEKKCSTELSSGFKNVSWRNVSQYKWAAQELQHSTAQYRLLQERAVFFTLQNKWNAYDFWQICLNIICSVWSFHVEITWPAEKYSLYLDSPLSTGHFWNYLIFIKFLLVNGVFVWDAAVKL